MSGSITPTPPPGGAAAGAGPRLSADLGTFLRLLTTQLRNQDPTKPMDTETLTQQLVQFATVEQQIAGNQTLNRMLDLQQAGQVAGAASLLGRRVTVESDTLPLQEGQAELILPAAGALRTAIIEIRDTAGNLLRSESVPLGATPTRWRWDGRDQQGALRPDGGYAVSATGRRADGTTSPISVAVTGRVTSVTRSQGDLTLRLGSATVAFDRLREVPGTP